jgi:hypothetical protein
MFDFYILEATTSLAQGEYELLDRIADLTILIYKSPAITLRYCNQGHRIINLIDGYSKNYLYVAINLSIGVTTHREIN